MYVPIVTTDDTHIVSELIAHNVLPCHDAVVHANADVLAPIPTGKRKC